MKDSNNEVIIDGNKITGNIILIERMKKSNNFKGEFLDGGATRDDRLKIELAIEIIDAIITLLTLGLSKTVTVSAKITVMWMAKELVKKQAKEFAGDILKAQLAYAIHEINENMESIQYFWKIKDLEPDNRCAFDQLSWMPISKRAELKRETFIELGASIASYFCSSIFNIKIHINPLDLWAENVKGPC